MATATIAMDEMKIRNIIREIMGEGDSELMHKRQETVNHLAEHMSITDLKHLAVKEAASMIECYAMGDIDKMLYEYYELEMAICALKKHLPEFMPETQHKKAIENYYSSFVKEA